MYDLSISDIKSNMVDSSSGTVTDGPSGAHLERYHTTHTGCPPEECGSLRLLLRDAHYIGSKSGTVNTGIDLFHRICNGFLQTEVHM